MKLIHIIPFNEYSAKDAGYGNAATMMCKVYDNLVENDKVEIARNTTFTELVKDDSSDTYDIGIIVFNPYSLIGQPSIMKQIAQVKPRINKLLLSVVWETTPLPPKWKEVFDSDLFDGFVTPSFFVLNNVKKMTDKPVFYYPHYIDSSRFTVQDLELRKKEKEFNVLFIGQNTKRKGLEDAVISFTRALHDKEDARLVVKHHAISRTEMDPEGVIVQLSQLNFRPINSRIFSIKDNMNQEEMNLLYQMASVIICPSRGEGFGLPAAEGMASGLPVIYTDWSALPEICNGGNNYPVGYTLDEAYSMFQHGYDVGLHYAVPKVKDLMSSLIECYDKWKTDREAYYMGAEKNRDIIISRFGLDHVTECVMHIIKCITTGDTSTCSDLTKDIMGDLIYGKVEDTDEKCKCKQACSSAKAGVSQAVPVGVCGCSHGENS